MKSFTAIKEMDDDILSVFIHNDDNEDYDYEYEYNMIDTNTKINTNANSSDIQCITKSYCEITLSNIIICTIFIVICMGITIIICKILH